MQYVATHEETSPGLLQIHHGGRSWRLRLEHATINEALGPGPKTAHPHVHPMYHLILFMPPFNTFDLNGQQVMSRPNMLVLCPPGVPHDFGPVQQGFIRYHELTFSLAAPSGRLEIAWHDLLSEYAGLTLEPLPLTRTIQPSLTQRLTQSLQWVIRQASSGSTLGPFAAHQAILDIFSMLIEEAAGRRHGGDWLDEARRQLIRRYASPLRIIDLAEELGVSPTYLARAFRQRYKVSPVQFRQELRLSAAARLLRSSSLSCKEVADRLGFPDVQTFTKAFARHHGQPPARFANSFR